MDKGDNFDNKNGIIIEWDGKELQTTHYPYKSDVGDHYVASALDSDGNVYIITWDMNKLVTPGESEPYDWDKPAGITLIK